MEKYNVKWNSSHFYVSIEREVPISAPPWNITENQTVPPIRGFLVAALTKN